VAAFETSLTRQTGTIELVMGFTPKDIVTSEILEGMSPLLQEILKSSNAGPNYYLTLLNVALQDAEAGGYPNTFVVNVVGFDETSATALLEAMGFTVEVEYATSITAAAGTITAQSVAAGSALPETAEITLTSSSGLPVPDVAGMTDASATGLLESLGFTVSTAEEASETVVAGLVISQSVTAGDPYPEVMAIRLMISTSPAE
jgi:hypothetical protein